MIIASIRQSLVKMPFTLRAPVTFARQVCYGPTHELHLDLSEKLDQQIKKIQNLVRLLKEHTPPLYNLKADRIKETMAKFNEVAKNLRSMLIAPLKEFLASGNDSLKKGDVDTAVRYFEMVIERGIEIQFEDEKVKLWVSEACYHKAICLIAIVSENQDLANDTNHCLKITNLIKESLQFNPNNELARSLLKIFETPS